MVSENPENSETQSKKAAKKLAKDAVKAAKVFRAIQYLGIF